MFRQKIAKNAVFICFALLMFNGCVGVRTNHKKDLEQQEIIQSLTQEIDHLHGQLSQVQKQKDRDVVRLENAQKELISRLHSEIEAKNAVVEMSERGLVIQLLAQIVFDSGKAQIKSDGKKALYKVVDVLKSVDQEVRIEGHTDNEPIKNSRHLYATNWELSSARAMSVLHYLIGNGVDPRKISAAGYGEHHPVATNKTKKGREQNRRVEIVILPQKINRVKPDSDE